MKKCADKMAEWLIAHGAIEENDKQLYEYAIYSIFLSLSPLLLAMTIGLFMNCIKESIMMIIPFVLIRKYSGGYHAKSSVFCFFFSSLLLILCMELFFHVKIGWMLLAITLGASASLIYFSPIDHENRSLSQYEKTHYKKVTAIFVISFLLVGFGFYKYGLHTYTVCVAIGILLCAGLQIPCVFLKKVEKK